MSEATDRLNTTTYGKALKLLSEGKPIDAMRLLRDAGMSLKMAHETLDFLAEYCQPYWSDNAHRR
jgi:hypothetical protein